MFSILTVMETIAFEVMPAEEGVRIDKVLTDKLPDFSRSQVQKLIKNGLVNINQQPAKPSLRVEPGDIITVAIPELEIPPPPVPQNPIPVDIIYEDEHLIAVNKPAGMVVHPSRGHREGTLVNTLMAYYPQLATFEDPERAGVVHRLDKLTSGVIVLALTVEAQEKMMELFRNRQVEKIYWGLVDGHPPTDKGRIDAPIGTDHIRFWQRRAIKHDGKLALSEFYTLERFAEHTLLKLHPITGRTHQLRLHVALIGCPIVGDQMYGRPHPSLPLDRFFLHAKSIRFTHPLTGQELSLETDLPDELNEVLEELRQQQR
jgi:23S rRNA pseudouridine1911/1915/1917 synthase